MATSRADLILHPVRLRLLAALAHRQLTARQLSELLPDIPQATLYHQLGKLTRSGLLRVVSERQVRGAVEKLYALDEKNTAIGPADLENATREDHLRYFTIFVAMVLGDFTRYLHQEAPDAPIDPFADGVSYSEGPLYLSDDEFAQAATALRQALLPFMSNEPAPHRRRRLLTTIVFPDADFPPEDGTEQK
ncbi:MAG TPA: helix-turn-helix domain-containing protein [Ktedonobacteraceae bacterium]|nr:helix-turn-helix domain-containing protein [Ktedonobacteraceae bacterium]